MNKSRKEVLNYTLQAMPPADKKQPRAFSIPITYVMEFSFQKFEFFGLCFEWFYFYSQ